MNLVFDLAKSGPKLSDHYIKLRDEAVQASKEAHSRNKFKTVDGKRVETNEPKTPGLMVEGHIHAAGSHKEAGKAAPSHSPQKKGHAQLFEEHMGHVQRLTKPGSDAAGSFGAGKAPEPQTRKEGAMPEKGKTYYHTANKPDRLTAHPKKYPKHDYSTVPDWMKRQMAKDKHEQENKKSLSAAQPPDLKKERPGSVPKTAKVQSKTAGLPPVPKQKVPPKLHTSKSLPAWFTKGLYDQAMRKQKAERMRQQTAAAIESESSSSEPAKPKYTMEHLNAARKQMGVQPVQQVRRSDTPDWFKAIRVGPRGSQKGRAKKARVRAKVRVGHGRSRQQIAAMNAKKKRPMLAQTQPSKFKPKRLGRVPRTTRLKPQRVRKGLPDWFV